MFVDLCVGAIDKQIFAFNLFFMEELRNEKTAYKPWCVYLVFMWLGSSPGVVFKVRLSVLEYLSRAVTSLAVSQTDP